MTKAECWARIWAALTKKRKAWPMCHSALMWVHHREHWIHTHLHTLYFGFVAFESHGHYGKIAGVLFVLSIIGAVSGAHAGR